MTDIQDKLKQLKKERKARSRSKQVTDSWQKIEKQKGLSTKDKLQQLINLTGKKKARKIQSAPPPFEAVSREPIQFLENPYPLDTRYGKVTLASGLEIGGDILTCLSKDTAFETLDLSSALFIDLETTGLSSGTGIIPFLVGMGYYRDDRFYVSQYFLGELAEEERMMEELAQFFSDMNFQSVVTYNGKAFDLPLLETRFILYRKPLILSELPHLDFLFPARSLWAHKYENCRLHNLALEVVETGRTEDIPSAEVPWRYFQYIHTGNYELVEPVLYHNQEDILSLLGVIIVGSQVFSEDRESGLADAMDFYGAGKILERFGKDEKSIQFYERALEGDLTDEISTQAQKKLSYHFKKKQGWEQAVLIWKEMASAEVISAQQLFSFRELAMYYEHKEKKYEEAKKITEEGLVLSFGTSSYFENDFRHRLDRLNQKIRKQKETK